jgi:hypothetical protein
MSNKSEDTLKHRQSLTSGIRLIRWSQKAKDKEMAVDVLTIMHFQ